MVALTGVHGAHLWEGSLGEDDQKTSLLEDGCQLSISWPYSNGLKTKGWEEQEKRYSRRRRMVVHSDPHRLNTAVHNNDGNSTQRVRASKEQRNRIGRQYLTCCTACCTNPVPTPPPKKSRRRAHTFPQAPSPTMTSFLLISLILSIELR